MDHPRIAIIDYLKENGTGKILSTMLRPGNKSPDANISVRVLALKFDEVAPKVRETK